MAITVPRPNQATPAAPSISSVTVVVVTYRSRADVLACLSSLRDNGVSGTSVVVDNASRDGTPDVIDTHFPEVRVISLSTNRGFGAACNIGATTSTSKYCLFLNPDARLTPGALQQLIVFAESHADAGIVAPQVLDPDAHTRQLSCRGFPTLGSFFFNRYSLLNRLFPGNRWGRSYLLLDEIPSTSTAVDWVSGCCMLVRREVLTALGGFDEQFFLFSEDVDLCLRARQARWVTYYVPEATAIHRIGGSSALFRPIIERHKSVWRYYRKHMTADDRMIQNAFVWAAIMVRCVSLVGLCAVRRLLRKHL
jgi:N-acetylglucosaminyl-diphospho-decaprenol L-rhamnosyltransferase